MPIFYQQDIDASTKLAVWKIEEEEDFFLEKVPLHRAITHPHKRLQHLAGRYLLQYLFPDFPIALIQIADTRKPFLEDEAYHFSISHCADFAAVIVSKEKRVGVDIEVVDEKVVRIKDKFSTREEQGEMENGKWKMENGGRRQESGAGMENEEMQMENGKWKMENGENTEVAFFTLVWSCKEAVFKWYGKGEVDFKKHIQIRAINTIGNGQLQTNILFTKESEQELILHSSFFAGVCLSYVF